MKEKNEVFILDSIDTYLKICKLAKAKGKKPGDSMEAEFKEIMQANPNKFQSLGVTDKDIGQITGDLRENGQKVLNFNELQRKMK